MALNKENLKIDLKSVFSEMKGYQGDEESALDVFVDKLAGVMITHIKTLSIKYTSGLSAPNGPVTGTINHTVE